jgi:hypothetical protein
VSETARACQLVTTALARSEAAVAARVLVLAITCGQRLDGPRARLDAALDRLDAATAHEPGTLRLILPPAAVAP